MTQTIGIITAEPIISLEQLEAAYQSAIRGRHVSEIPPILALRNLALDALPRLPPNTPEGHRQRHIELHRALDELFADYITQHPDEHQFTTMPLDRLLKWSHQQTMLPTERRG